MASDFEVLVDLVREQLNDDTISWGVFRVDETKKEGRRRVVWIPTEFRCITVQQANPMHDFDTGELSDIMLSDRLTVECHISGADFEDACEIRRNIINATWNVMHMSSDPIDGQYVTEMPGQAGHTWAGATKIIQRFEWILNVAKPDQESVEIVEIEQTTELQNTGHTDEELVITKS